MKKLFTVILFILFSSVVFAQDKFVNPPLEFSNTQLRTAIDTLFLKAGDMPYSLDLSPKDDLGAVTMKLTEKLPLDMLLKLVLDPKNLEFNKDADGVYHIRKKKSIGLTIEQIQSNIKSAEEKNDTTDMAAETKTSSTSIISKIYPLTYSVAEGILAQVKTVLSKNGKAVTDKENNCITVTDEPKNIEAIEYLLRELDNPEAHSKTIRICFRLIEIPHNNSVDLSLEHSFTKNFYSTRYIANLGLDEVIEYISGKQKTAVTVLDKAEILANDGAEAIQGNIKTTMQSQRDGTVTALVEYRWKDFYYRGKMYVVNGGTFWNAGTMESSGTKTKETILLTSLNIVDTVQPRSKDTPGIRRLELFQPDKNSVLISWSNDLPFGANGVFRYNIYRDEKPITSKDKNLIILGDLSGDYTSFSDSSPKQVGKEYFYAVTALNSSGLEQSLSKPVSIKFQNLINAKKENSPKEMTKRYILRYATAGEIVRQVRGVLTRTGNIETNPLTNELIITDDKEVFEGVANLLKELDNPSSKANDIIIQTSCFELPAGNSRTPDPDELKGFLAKETAGTYSYDCVRTDNDIALFLSKGAEKPDFFSCFLNSEDGTETKLNTKDTLFVVTPQSQRDGTVSFQYYLKNKITEIRTKTFTPQHSHKLLHYELESNIKRFFFLNGYGQSRTDTAFMIPPSCLTHTRNPELELSIIKDTTAGVKNVLIDWSKDTPMHIVGIYKYNIYCDSKLLVSNLKGNATSFVDTTTKEPGKTYNYAVTAVSHFNMEQEIFNTYPITYR